jgi:hypothetical protein
LLQYFINTSIASTVSLQDIIFLRLFPLYFLKLSAAKESTTVNTRFSEINRQHLKKVNKKYTMNFSVNLKTAHSHTCLHALLSN